MTEYYPGFIQDASGAWVTHPQAYQPIPGTTAGVDTGTLLQGSVSYTAPTPAPATNPWAGYTATTPTTLAPMTPIPSVLTPSTLTPMTPTYGTSSTPTLTGGVQTTQVPLNTELGQYNPPGYIAPLPQSQPTLYQAQPYYPTGSGSSTPTQIQSGGLGGGGVYGTVNSMSGTNQNVGQPSQYLQAPSTSTISTNPGAIGAFNPALYPNGITGYQSGDLAAAAAQAAAIQATVPDARFLPGGMFYGQNPTTTGQPMTSSIAVAIQQNPSAYPTTAVNLANQYTTPSGGTTSVQTPVNNYINDNDTTNNTNNNLSLALGAHNLTPAQGPNLGPLFQAMNAPIDNNQRTPFIAQAQSDWVSDAVDQTPYQTWRDAQPGQNPAPQNQPINQGGNLRGGTQDPFNPYMMPDPRDIMRNMPRSVEDPRSVYAGVVQRNELTRNQQILNEAPPSPRPYVNQGHPIRNALQNFNFAIGQRNNQMNQNINDANNAALNAWTQRQNNAANNSRQLASDMASNAQKSAEKAFEKAFELGKFFLERGVLTQDRAQKILEELTSTTAPGSPERWAAIEGYSRSTNTDFRFAFNMANSTADQKRRQDAAQTEGVALDNAYKRRTLDDRVNEQAAQTEKAQVDARVAKGTEQAIIATKQLDQHAKQLELDLEKVYGEPMKRAVLQNQLEQTLMMKKNATQAAFNGYQKSVQDYRAMQKQKNDLIINNQEEQAVQVEEEIQSIFGAREGGKDYTSVLIDTLKTRYASKGFPSGVAPNQQGQWLKAQYDNEKNQAVKKQLRNEANKAFLKSGSVPANLKNIHEEISNLRSQLTGYANQQIMMPAPMRQAGAKGMQASEERGAEQVAALAPIASGPVENKRKSRFDSSGITTINVGDQRQPEVSNVETIYITDPGPSPRKRKK